jgi:hypothetical protein
MIMCFFIYKLSIILIYNFECIYTYNYITMYSYFYNLNKLKWVFKCKWVRVRKLVRFNKLSGININNAIIKVIIEIVRLKELDNTMLSILIFLFFRTMVFSVINQFAL